MSRPKHGPWQIMAVTDSWHPTLKEHFEVYRVIDLGTKDAAFEWLKPNHRFETWREAWEAVEAFKRGEV